MLFIKEHPDIQLLRCYRNETPRTRRAGEEEVSDYYKTMFFMFFVLGIVVAGMYVGACAVFVLAGY